MRFLTVVIAIIICFNLNTCFCFANETIPPKINSYDAYLLFLENRLIPNWSDVPAKLPTKFVTYEQLSKFGEFDALRVSSGYNDIYTYEFIDTEGREFDIIVSHTEENYLVDRPQLSEENLDFQNMSTTSLEASINREYIYEGIRYLYLRTQNHLYSISWYADGISYTLLPPENISPDNTTAIGKLLNLETAKEVIPNAEMPVSRDIYVTNDTEKFLEDWYDALREKTNENLRLSSEETEVIIPKLNAKGFKLSFIEVNNKISDNYKYHYKYRYEPIYYDGEYQSAGKGIDVYVYPKSSTEFDGGIHDDPCLWETINGHEVEVVLPNGTFVRSEDELKKYVEFELIDVLNYKNSTDDDAPPAYDKTPAWKVSLIVGSCAAVVAVAAIGTVVVVKKKKSK